MTQARPCRSPRLPSARASRFFISSSCSAACAARAWLKSRRGPGGGFELARPAAELRIADIVTSVDEDIRVTRCEAGSADGCMADKARCLTHDLWEELGRQIFLFLNAVSLEDVAEGRMLGAARLFAPDEHGAASAHAAE